MAVTTPPLGLSTVGPVIDRQIDDASDFGSLPNGVIVHQKDTGEVFFKDSSGVKIGLFDIGLTNFTEAVNTSAPNGTVPVVSLTANNAATDVDIAWVIKGTGAILAQIPDGGAGGGNKRGTNAIDLQMLRAAAGDIASGDRAVVMGGETNRATGNNSITLAGLNNHSTGVYSMSGGRDNVAAGNDSGAFGRACTASFDHAFAMGHTCQALAIESIAMGNVCTTNGNASIAMGQSCNTTGLASIAFGIGCTATGGGAGGAYAFGNNCVAGGSFGMALVRDADTFTIANRIVFGKQKEGVDGDSQKSLFLLGVRTTDATVTTLTSRVQIASATNQVILQNDNVFRFKGSIVAKESGSTNVAAWDIDGLIVRGVNAASTSLNVENVVEVENLEGWGVPVLTANTTDGGLKIEVEGLAGTDIQWFCDVETKEVIYA